MSITLEKNKAVILIDTSYFVFYRYFSTLRWFQFRNEDIDYSTITDNETFMEAFYKHVQDDFKKLCKSWDTTLSQFIFCCDCSRGTIWRNNFTNGYKSLRIQNQTFNPTIFTKFYAFIEKLNLHKIAIDCLEADDVVYLTKQLMTDEQCIIIITNDNDYLQIVDERTKIFNMSGKGNDITTRSCGNPQKDLLIKIIMGDKSDNILPIHKGIGAVTANKLASLSETDLETYLIEKNCKDTFENNRLLIDFKKIPVEYIETFKASVSIGFT
jgi:5'-3' exonuclease